MCMSTPGAKAPRLVLAASCGPLSPRLQARIERDAHTLLERALPLFLRAQHVGRHDQVEQHEDATVKSAETPVELRRPPVEKIAQNCAEKAASHESCGRFRTDGHVGSAVMCSAFPTFSSVHEDRREAPGQARGAGVEARGAGDGTGITGTGMAKPARALASTGATAMVCRLSGKV